MSFRCLKTAGGSTGVMSQQSLGSKVEPMASPAGSWLNLRYTPYYYMGNRIFLFYETGKQASYTIEIMPDFYMISILTPYSN